MNQAYLIDALRTPIGKFAGALSTVRADDLAALTFRKLLERHSQIDPAEIGDVILGCANQAGEDNRNIARMALLLAGLPVTVPGLTVNRLCASGLAAAVHAARAARLGEGRLYLAGGVEHMTRAPYALAKPSTPFGRDSKLYDTSLGWRFVNPEMERLYGIDSMGQTAENVAELYSVSREDQDRFAFGSQRKAALARESGRFKDEIVAVPIPQKRSDPIPFEEDEFIRPDTTPEALSKLRPAFGGDGRGTVTAGNASGINDGACALLIASEKALRDYRLTPLARLVSWSAVGVEPRLMGMGPVEATRKALTAAGLTLDQMDVIEINEAFAAQVLACVRQLGIDDDDPRLNPNGGAIALGHPLGMSGARLLSTAAIELKKQMGRYALCTMCVGVGQGMAAVIERASG